MMETLETWKLPCYNHVFKETIWKLDGNPGNLNKKTAIITAYLFAFRPTVFIQNIYNIKQGLAAVIV